jgi:hypothetical protein
MRDLLREGKYTSTGRPRDKKRLGSLGLVYIGPPGQKSFSPGKPKSITSINKVNPASTYRRNTINLL